MCKESKSIDQFSKCSAREDGLQNYCKLCAKIKRGVRYREKIDEERAQNRQWHLDNKPWLDQEKKNYINEWRRSHDRSIENNRRRGLLYGAEGSHTFEEWLSLVKATGYVCLRCLRSDVKLTQDHIVPLSKGGSDYIDNIQPLCGPCNSSKGDRIIDYRRSNA